MLDVDIHADKYEINLSEIEMLIVIYKLSHTNLANVLSIRSRSLLAIWFSLQFWFVILVSCHNDYSIILLSNLHNLGVSDEHYSKLI